MKKPDEKPTLDKLAQDGAQGGAEDRVKKDFFSYFKKVESKLSFGRQVEKIYDLLVSGKLSRRDKAIVLGALIYFINPLDIIPDPTLFIGFLDDMGVVALVYRYLSHRSDDEFSA